MLTLSSYLICLLGFLAFNFFLFKSEKSEADDKGEHFHFKGYAEKMWDDWIFSGLSSLGLLLISPDIFLYLVSHFEACKNLYWSDVFPFLIGSFGGYIFVGVYEIVKKLIAKFKKKVE